ALLVRVERGDHAGHEERGAQIVATEQVQDARHAHARAVLALSQPAGRSRALAQGARLVVRIERQGYARARPVLPARWLQRAAGSSLVSPPAARPVLPARWLQRAAGSYLVHRRAPARFVPRPGRLAGAVAGRVMSPGT